MDLRQFLEELIGQMASGDGGRPSIVRTELKADDLEIDPDKLAPLALFAVEAIANARRRAFVEGEGLIKVSFKVLEEEVALEISDNGVEDAACEAAEGGRAHADERLCASTSRPDGDQHACRRWRGGAPDLPAARTAEGFSAFAFSTVVNAEPGSKLSVEA